MSRDRAGPSLRRRWAIMGTMLAAAVVVSGLLAPDPATGLVAAIVTVPLFPIGLGYAFHERGPGQSDAAFALVLLAPYAVYGALGYGLAVVKSRMGFIAMCALLAVVLAITVKGCQDGRAIRWFNS